MTMEARRFHGRHGCRRIDFIDERDSGFGVLVRAGNDPVPDIGSEDHAGAWRLFDRAAGKVGVQKRLAITERYG